MAMRSDLALELKEGAGEVEGVTSEVIADDAQIRITRVRILNEEGEKAIGKPCGVYISIELPPMGERGAELTERVAHCVQMELGTVLGTQRRGSVLVVGLGNRRLTADSLGVRTVDEIMVTRHLMLSGVEGLPEYVSTVSALAPGVLGVTGIESADVVGALCGCIAPDAVIVVDSLAAGAASRIGSVIQLADTGIAPGSGVGNSRCEISKSTLGVPVVAIGVPTVVYASTLVEDMGGEAPGELRELVVTPKEVDVLIAELARMLSTGINLYVHSGISIDEINAFLK